MIDLAKLVDGGLDDLFAKVFIHDVASKRKSLTTGVCDFLCHLLSPLLVQVRHDDLGAVLGKEERCRPSNALARSGNDGHLVTEKSARQVGAQLLGELRETFVGHGARGVRGEEEDGFARKVDGWATPPFLSRLLAGCIKRLTAGPGIRAFSCGWQATRAG